MLIPVPPCFIIIFAGIIQSIYRKQSLRCIFQLRERFSKIKVYKKNTTGFTLLIGSK